MPPCPARAWRLAAALAALFALPACLVFVSTAPGGLTNANIVFIAVTEDGGLVARLHVTVVSTDGGWRQEGTTSADGTFRVAVEPERWPREIDVAREDIEVRVRVRRG